ncbi:hypothetical protein RZE82_03170 [Mollicutes bacterium LVI A0039]|nr:hypothetical protein RZE82_03170 [Mollicutes bacterium LVI A0039]
MIELSMPLNRDKVKNLLAESSYENIEIISVTEQGIKLNVEATGDLDKGAREIKDQLKKELGGGFFFAVNVI